MYSPFAQHPEKQPCSPHRVINQANLGVRDVDLDVMRASNVRFAAAVKAGDVDGALRADDELHDVLVRVAGNRAAAATVARYTPLIRRLERRRFGEGGSCRSAGLHDRLIEACAAGDTEAAVRITADIWRSLAELADPD